MYDHHGQRSQFNLRLIESEHHKSQCIRFGPMFMQIFLFHHCCVDSLFKICSILCLSTSTHHFSTSSSESLFQAMNVYVDTIKLCVSVLVCMVHIGCEHLSVINMKSLWLNENLLHLPVVRLRCCADDEIFH